MSTNNSSNIPTGVSGTILQGQGAGVALELSTATYPATTTVSQMLYSSATNTVAGLATANNGVLIASNTGVPSMLAAGTTGQGLNATTGAPPSWGASPTLRWELLDQIVGPQSNAPSFLLTVASPELYSEYIIVCNVDSVVGGGSYPQYLVYSDGGTSAYTAMYNRITTAINVFTTTLIEAHDTVDMNRKQTTLHIINAGVSLFPLFYAYGMTNATARGMAQGLINSGGANFNAFRLQMASGDTGMTDSQRYFKVWGRR